VVPVSGWQNEQSASKLPLAASQTKTSRKNACKPSSRDHLRNAATLSWLVRPVGPRHARLSGRPVTFLTAVGIVVIWAVTGPIFNYSDTWQLVINTGTTIVTFLMVFLIQATQNRDTTALQLKLDELIIATKNARNAVAGIEESADHILEAAKLEMKERSGSKS
jgi:low affinity Fe/Cu permease